MTTHRGSIFKPTQDRAQFAPPPPIRLGERARAEPQSRSRGERASAPIVRAVTLMPPPTLPPSWPSKPRPSLRKRLIAVLLVLAVPAMAAPGDFGAIAGDAAKEPGAGGAWGEPDGGPDTRAIMPFERPGLSFPGSAFYYLADPPHEALVTLPESNPALRRASGSREIGARIDAGPAARPFMAGTGASLARAQECLAQAIWYEAASESVSGQRAVAQVVLNRVAHTAWPGSVCGVVYQGSERKTGCQFSFTCDGSLSRRASGRGWTAAQRLASEALKGSVYAPIGHATHYHTLWVNPRWAKRLTHVGTIGAHRFYRNRGKAGAASAFRSAYTGSEPAIGRRLSAAARPPLSAPSGAPLSAASAPTSAPSEADLATTPSPTFSPQPGAAGPAQTLTKAEHSEVGQTREAFAKAGQWKVDPATLDLSGKNPGAPTEEKGAQADADKPAERDPDQSPKAQP
ncbi:MAG: cell wall hydrolase [Pseudomonadota bacterium]